MVGPLQNSVQAAVDQLPIGQRGHGVKKRHPFRSGPSPISSGRVSERVQYKILLLFSSKQPPQKTLSLQDCSVEIRLCPWHAVSYWGGALDRSVMLSERWAASCCCSCCCCCWCWCCSCCCCCWCCCCSCCCCCCCCCCSCCCCCCSCCCCCVVAAKVPCCCRGNAAWRISWADWLPCKSRGACGRKHEMLLYMVGM